MDNRFLLMDQVIRGASAQPDGRGAIGVADRPAETARSFSGDFAHMLSAQNRALVILIENGGVDLGIPALVDKLLDGLPGSSLIPGRVRQQLVERLHDTIKGLTDNLLETAELSINRYTAAQPELFGQVTVLRDGTASYADLRGTLLDLSRHGKIVDLLILTHGSDRYISVPGGIDDQKIRAMKAGDGKPLSIRSVYMMNCVGSSLNQAWLDAGAKVSSGALRNNYLPEPTTFFFWQNWKDGQPFEAAVTSAYRKTINLMNAAVQSLIGDLPIPGASSLAASLDFASFEFVKDSAPVIQGQRSVTINTDDLTFSQSVASSLVTTVLPTSVISSLAQSDSAAPKQPMTLSDAGVEFIKSFEGFYAHMYNDPVGHCTIGYGTLLHKGNCNGDASEQAYVNGISKEDATRLLAQEAAGIQQSINASVRVPLNQNQNDALVSFAYNVGVAAFQKSTLLKLLNQGQYAAVPTELRKWTKARQNGKLVDLPGLVKRRNAEAELFQKPVAATTQSLAPAAAMQAQTLGYGVPGGRITDPFYRDADEGKKLTGRHTRPSHRGMDVSLSNAQGGDANDPRRGLPVYATIRPTIDISELNAARAADAAGHPLDGLGIDGTGTATLKEAVVDVQRWEDSRSFAYGGVIGLACHYAFTRSNGSPGSFTLYVEYLHLITPRFLPKDGQGKSISAEAWGATGKGIGFGPRMQQGARLSAADLAVDPPIVIGYLGATEFPHVHIQVGYADGEHGYVKAPRVDPTVVIQASRSLAGSGAQSLSASALPITHSFRYESPSFTVATAQSGLAFAQNPAAAVIAGIEVADAAQIGLAGIAIAQAQVAASQGSFTLVYDKAQRLLTPEARAQMPGSQTSKQSYSHRLLWIGSDAPLWSPATANIIIEWEGNPYGEIGTPVIRRELGTSSEWSKSSATITITRVDRIPLPKTDPRTWPIVYTYEGTYDPAGNGYFEFSGEFEVNAFGGLKFNRHQVVSRSAIDWAISGKPEDYVQKGADVIVPVPPIPQEQIDYLRTRLP